ncbi:Mediator of RNA polymerase II transcription subunit 6 [Hypsibius exemplaris]|uniref:Mediator of RNA polymerase II transcription subunit 6 n=1 Tax=Hypsibius exemplaris TaxID=2072580 RepID=A0A1W0WYE7_HYPEX|nr:Mediator of RNA polymerase II transcription subunit 6 [Hypsibius exemplaris]
MNASKQNNVSSAVSLNPKDTDLLLSWSDAIWVPHLTSANVMEYFAQPSNPFYDPQCNNEIIRMQRQSLDQLKNMVGIEYELAHAQDPILYIIKRQQRISPTDAITLAHYYILAGTVYQAPDLWSVINSRLLNTSHFLFTAQAELNSFVRFHPANGYHWEIKPPTGSNISFVPMDATRKEPEEAGTQFQRKNVDGILGALTQRFPFKPMPASQHPFGPRGTVAAEQQPAANVSAPPTSAQPPSETTVAPLPAGSDRAQNHQLFNAMLEQRAKLAPPAEKERRDRNLLPKFSRRGLRQFSAWRHTSSRQAHAHPAVQTSPHGASGKTGELLGKNRQSTNQLLEFDLNNRGLRCGCRKPFFHAESAWAVNGIWCLLEEHQVRTMSRKIGIGFDLGPTRKLSIPNLDADDAEVVPPAGKPFAVGLRSETSERSATAAVQSASTFGTAAVRISNRSSIACGTADFTVSLDSQTDDVDNYPSWTQAPPPGDLIESAHDKSTPFSQILRQPATKPPQSSDSVRLHDPVRFSAFLRKAGGLILDMLAEDAYDTKVTRRKNPLDEALVIGQDTCGKSPLFEYCRIEAVSVSVATASGTSAPIFLQSHSIISNTGTVRGRLRGFVSGWSSLSVSDPLFLLAACEVPTCAVSLLGGAAVVAGHADGSLACWDRGEALVPYESLSAGRETPNGGGFAGMRMGLACFHSAAAKDDNHSRPVVDLIVLTEGTSGRETGDYEHTSCASLDDTGVILIWNCVFRGREETAKEVDVVGAVPGGRFVLVRLRRILAWKDPGFIASHLDVDPFDRMIFYVASRGRLSRVHRDGVSLRPDAYTTDSDARPAFSLTDRDHFLVAGTSGRILLYDKNFSNPVMTWSSPGGGRIVGLNWSAVNPSLFFSTTEDGVITLWNLRTGVSEPERKTARVTSDAEDGAAVVRWQGVVRGASDGGSLLFWTPRSPPVLVFLNPRFLTSPGSSGSSPV